MVIFLAGYIAEYLTDLHCHIRFQISFHQVFYCSKIKAQCSIGMNRKHVATININIFDGGVERHAPYDPFTLTTHPFSLRLLAAAIAVGSMIVGIPGEQLKIAPGGAVDAATELTFIRDCSMSVLDRPVLYKWIICAVTVVGITPVTRWQL